MRRAAPEATDPSKTAGRDDASSMIRSLVESGASMRDVIVAGGLRGLTVKEICG